MLTSVFGDVLLQRIQRVSVPRVIAGNDSEVFSPWEQACDSVLIAVDLLCGSELCGGTDITFQDTIISLLVVCYIWAVI